VERTLGMLKKHFSNLKVATFHTQENHVKVPVATAIFHILIRTFRGDEEWLDHQTGVIDLTQFVAQERDDQTNDPCTTKVLCHAKA
jgi:hypothetical protein